MYISEKSSKEEVVSSFEGFKKSLHEDKVERPTHSGNGDAIARQDVRVYEDNCHHVGKGVSLYPDLGEQALDIFDKAIDLKRKNSASLGLYSALGEIYQVRPDLRGRILGATDKALSQCQNDPYALSEAVLLLDKLAQDPQTEQKAVEIFSKNLNSALTPVEGKQSVAFMYQTEGGKEVLGAMNRREAKLHSSSIPMAMTMPSRQAGD